MWKDETPSAPTMTDEITTQIVVEEEDTRVTEVDKEWTDNVIYTVEEKDATVLGVSWIQADHFDTEQEAREYIN